MDLERMKKNRKQVILQFAIPSIIAMVLTSMINIVDGFFIGNYVGTEGLAAVNLGLPIVYLYLAVGLLISVGGVSIAGRLLGAGKIEESNNIFRQTMTVATLVSIVITVLLFFLLEPLSGLFNTDAETIGHFKDYYGVMLLELPMMIVVSSFGMFIRGEGNPAFVMKTNILNVVLNIILDYIFIKPLGLGTAGIAWASVIAVFLVLLVNIGYFLKRSKVFKLGRFTFSGDALRGTIFNGSSEFIGEMAMCLSMAAYNYVILKYIGVDGVAAFTVVGYVTYVFSMIIVGFGQGIVPIISFTYGAEEKKTARQMRATTNGMVAIAAVAIFVLMTLLTEPYCRIFVDKIAVMDMVASGLRIQMTSFVFAGINTITSFYFTAIGKAKESAIISSARGLIVLMICIFTLPALFGITGVWFVSLVTETVTVCISIIFIHRENSGKGKGEIVYER